MAVVLPPLLFDGDAVAPPIQLALGPDRSAMEANTGNSHGWIRAEAYLKAVGVGFSDSLPEFSFQFHGQSSLHFRSRLQAKAEQWDFALFAPADRARLAVAVRSDQEAFYRVSKHGEQNAPLRIIRRSERLPR